MSDTLRTDVLLIAHDMSPEPKALIKHGRDLEHQLNAANERIKRLEELYQDQLEITRNWKGAAYSIADDMLKAKEAKL